MSSPAARTTTPSSSSLQPQLQHIGLRALPSQLDDFLARAAKARWSPHQILEQLAQAEIAERSRRSLERRLRLSGIKRFKPMADFDWSWPSKIERDVIERALTLDFIPEARNLVLVGRNGFGKTMIAQNICHGAVLAGYSVLFRSAAALLEELHRQSPEGRRRKLRSYPNIGLLCIDLCEVVSNVELSAGSPASWRSGRGATPHLSLSIGESPFGDESYFAEVPMLKSLLPKAHARMLALPLLGPIADGFDDWLAANGYTAGSRKYAIRMLPHVDNDLRKRKARTVAELNHSTLHASWRHLIKRFPMNAGTVRSLESYLTAVGKIVADDRKTVTLSVAEKLSDEYVTYLREVRGFAIHSMANHRRVSQAFLDHADRRRASLKTLQPKDIEVFVTQAGKRLCRGSLQHEIAALRGLLRFLALDGRVPPGLHKQIDTPRLYRLEQLPRALPWPTVIELLKSLDLTSDIGLRDYAMFLLIATYGLRASEVVELTLDDVAWRKGVLRIHQRKTASPLELPLTNEVATALTKHLKRSTPPVPYRRIFLRKRAPIGMLKPTAVTEAFQSLVRHSKLSIPFEGPHCLRHSLAVHLLKSGTPLKTIGDILGHRTAESTSMYLRLATGDLRGVSLAVPRSGNAGKGVRR